MSNYGNIKIIGEGILSEGEYYKIGIVGQATSIGKIKCSDLKVIGTLVAKENIQLATGKILGEVTMENGCTVTDNMKLLGELKVEGNFKTEGFHVLGQGNFKKDLIYNNINLLGEITVRGNCEGTVFTSKGKATINGLLSADRIDIDPMETSVINEIGGSDILIKRRKLNIFTSRNGKVICESIEGDNIVLEKTNAKIVRGKNITILGNCNIDRIEYTGEITVDRSSRVGEVICQKN